MGKSAKNKKKKFHYWYKKLSGYVHKMAWSFYFSHRWLAQEDLYQEGVITMYNAYMAYKGTVTNDEMKRILMTSVKNRMLRLIQDDNNNIRASDVYEAYDIGSNDNVFEYKEYILHIELDLSDLAKAVLKQLIDPCPEIMKSAVIDQKRKQYLGDKYNINIRGANVVRVYSKHIQTYLKIDVHQYGAAIAEIEERIENLRN